MPQETVETNCGEQVHFELAESVLPDDPNICPICLRVHEKSHGEYCFAIINETLNDSWPSDPKTAEKE
jgi:hypothetical protein